MSSYASEIKGKILVVKQELYQAFKACEDPLVKMSIQNR